jgi:hypothetical protein
MGGLPQADHAVGDRSGDLIVEVILGRKPRGRSTCAYVFYRCQCLKH